MRAMRRACLRMKRWWQAIGARASAYLESLTNNEALAAVRDHYYSKQTGGGGDQR